ncbi:MAG: penicillin-binding protein [Clostridia bacterium]|nr:penicillin-binding protein [Clostridia bacterium]
MNKLLKSRYHQMLCLLMVAMAVLGIRLFVLTVVQHQEWNTYASEISVKSVYTSAPRGEILDRYGRVLAGNIQTFSIKFSPGNLSNEEINDVALRLIRLLEANGDTYRDEFPIKIENGNYRYTYQDDIENWLASQGMPLDLTAEEAFDRLRESLSIDAALSRYDAQSEMQNVYKIYPPISVKYMKFTKELDKESFLGKFYLEEDLTAKEAFSELRKKFKIDESLSEDEARKILIIRNEIASMGYRKYMPVTLATGVSDKTIILLEEQSGIFPGVEVSSETVRSYPNGSTAAHILGYLGKISESDKPKYVDELGYNASDLIGKDGIESVYESQLKGVDGVKNIQVNAHGEMVKLINETEPKKGKDIYLTIDLELQKTAEEALAQALPQIQRGGTFVSQYGNYGYGKAFRNANVGAVVAIEVETGDVLAMASYPDFDPNLFATGISSENWNALQSTNSRDPLAPAPLYNVAARSAVQPGSTFKMVTATAALESGLDPNRKLYDGGYVQVGNRTYGCLIWNRSKGSHGYVDLKEALEVSCNYYFYDLVTGKDLYRNASLGLKEPNSIEKIMSYAKQYGLGEPTGIEISETVTPLPSAERKMASIQAMLRNVLIGRAEKYFKEEVVADKTLLNDYIEEIVSWAEENPTRGETIKRMSKVGIKEDMIETVADLCKFTYFNQAQWTLGDELNISIGQGENAYTPLQMANYIATIGNEGVRNKVSLISAIEGQGKIKKEPGQKIEIKNDSGLKAIIEGMKLVATGPKGSLKGIFKGFPVQVAAKSGTAERGGKINPPDEVAYMQQHIGQIAPGMSWDAVENEMTRLMSEYSDIFTSRDSAVRQAVINLSNGSVTTARIDAYKSDYDNFAWIMAMAPAEDPKIAVAVLVFQGGTAGYAAPIAREVIGKYLQLDKTYEDYSLGTSIQ